MVLATQKILQLLPIFVALSGFFLALYIFTKKKRKETLVCVLNSNCNAVIHSKYSTFLGAPLEILGMIYFGFITLFLLFLFFMPHFNYGYFLFIAPMATFGAFLFSLYLGLIQVLLIKQWCVWCLVSALLCSAEFILILILSPLNIKNLLLVIF